MSLASLEPRPGSPAPPFFARGPSGDESFGRRSPGGPLGTDSPSRAGGSTRFSVGFPSGLSVSRRMSSREGISPGGLSPQLSPGGRDFMVDRERGAISPKARSRLPPPPIGSKTNAWGKYDTIPEILARPHPAPPIHMAERKTMALQGGRWSRYEPITPMYIISRIAESSPGPGTYGVSGNPDPVLSSKCNPFGKLSGGRFSTSRRTTAVDELESYARKIPGPGAYDTDHIHGISKRIFNASFTASLERRVGTAPIAPMYLEEDDASEEEGGSPMRRQGGDDPSPTERPTSRGSWDDMASTGGGGGGQISMLQQVCAIEQGLVMSRKIPLSKISRLGTTRYSRLRKDVFASPVRKFRRETMIPVDAQPSVQFAPSDVDSDEDSRVG